MNQQLSSFAARLRETFFVGADVRSLYSSTTDGANNEPPHVGSYRRDFDSLALDLFALQFKHNLAYRKICEARKLSPDMVEHWAQIPAMPTAAFKEMELTSLAPDERTAVFHSSGTTEQKPSRHFHSAESLAVYEASLWAWFERNLVASFAANAPSSRPSPPVGEKVAEGRLRGEAMIFNLITLSPPSAIVPHSSLVHMFEVVRQKLGAMKSAFVGKLASDGSWTVDFDAALTALSENSKSKTQNPKLILGTAFSFVHLLDYLAENNLHFQLPEDSRVMETGGYKNRSRTMPKAELHTLITERLGVPRENILCEYGMSELSSQAYNGVRPSSGAATFNKKSPLDFRQSPGTSQLLRPGRAHSGSSVFQFPPWARVQIISPETGREVAEGETGLIRVCDLANVFSVAAVQTEDVAVRRGEGFELIGRAQQAEPRGCSLMTA